MNDNNYFSPARVTVNYRRSISPKKKTLSLIAVFYFHIFFAYQDSDMYPVNFFIIFFDFVLKKQTYLRLNIYTFRTNVLVGNN